MTREEWEKVVDHIVYKEEDSTVVLNARKKFFMDLFDITFDNRGNKLPANEKCADGSAE